MIANLNGNRWAEFGWLRSSALVIALLGCIEPGGSTPLEDQVDPSAIDAEVQRVFNDAACYCESYVINPNMGLAAARSDLVVATDVPAADSRLQRYVTSPQAGSRTGEVPYGCSALSPDAARASLSSRVPSASDLQTFACTGHLDAITRPFCRAEFDACLAHELELSAESTTRPLPSAVRSAVLTEANRRALTSVSTATTELTYRNTNCGSTPTDPDCTRVSGGYGGRLHQIVSDTVATSLDLTDRVTRVTLAGADRTTPGLVEGTSFGSAMFGATSARLGLLRTLYGGATLSIAASPPASPTASATILSPGGTMSTSVMPSNLALGAAQSGGIRVMPEQENFLLASPLTLGTITIPAGRRINVYLVHYDPVVVGAASAYGTITTDRPILGLLRTDAELSATQSLFARSGVTYPAASGRGLETDDTVQWNSQYLYGTLLTSTLDQFRIVTYASADVPETFVSTERGGDLPYAARLYGDASVQSALGLLGTHRIAFPHTACVEATTYEITGAAWGRARPASSSCPLGRAESECMFDELEAAVRLAAGRSPRATGELSLLETAYGLTPSHIGDAVDYVRDASSVMEGVVLAPVPTGTSRVCGPSVLHRLAPRPRSAITTLASLSRSGSGSLAGSTGTSFYASSTADVGTVGLAHAARVGILGSYPSDSVGRAAADDALGLLDAELGSRWSEWRVCDQSSCDGDPLHAGRWSVFERTGTALPNGVPVLVRSEADLACLLTGREALAPAAGCTHVTSNTSRYLPLTPVTTGLGSSGCPGALGAPPYCRRSYLAPNIVVEASSSDRRFVVWCARESTDPAGTCRSHRLMDVIYTGGGPQVHAFGGDTLADVVTALMVDPNEPAVPLYNALGLEHDLVPPLENELIETGDGREDSWAVYMSQAEVASSEAARLLESARTHELEDLAYDRNLEAELASVALAEQETVSGICGVDVPDGTCGLPRRGSITLAELHFVPDAASLAVPTTHDGTSCATWSPGPDPSGSDHTAWFNRFDDALRCARYQSLVTLAGVRLTELPEVVVAEVQAATAGSLEAGTFPVYGGQTRQELITLFGQLMTLQSVVTDFQATFEAAVHELNAHHGEFERLSNSWWDTLSCFARSAIRGLVVVVAVAAAVVAIWASGGTATPAIAAMALAGGSGLLGGAEQVLAEADACTDNDVRRQEIVDQAFGEVSLRLAEMAHLLVGAREAVLAAAAADGQFDDMEREVELARRRREIAERIATSGLGGDPTWRAIHVVERRRADEALFRAQRHLFVARRAVETRLAVDMTTMTAEEPYVAGPAFWANDVLDLSNAVEYVSVGGATVATDVRPEALADYLSALRGFMDGYPLSHRFSEGDDVQVINLGEVVGPPGGTTEQPLISRILFLCNDGSRSMGGVPAGYVVADPAHPPAPCGVFDTMDLGGVDRAILPFAIPTDLNGGYFGDRLAGGNFNHRIRSVAVNLVGRALFDCEAAARPTECYGDANIPFSMRHQGATILENWDGEHRFFAFEPGVITRARAVADERWLTNPLSTGDAAIIAPYERSEWWGRPLAGAYVLEVESRPEMDWSNLENVQVLLRYHYWTRQR